jgi:hypothetical protein
LNKFSSALSATPARQRWHKSMPLVDSHADPMPDACGGLRVSQPNRRIEIKKRNTKFADSKSANGSKRDVCDSQPDSTLPVGRFRLAFRHSSAPGLLCAPQRGATRCDCRSTFTNASPRYPPRAYAIAQVCQTLSGGLSAFPPLFNASAWHLGSVMGRLILHECRIWMNARRRNA